MRSATSSRAANPLQRCNALFWRLLPFGGTSSRCVWILSTVMLVGLLTAPHCTGAQFLVQDQVQDQESVGTNEHVSPNRPSESLSEVEIAAASQWVESLHLTDWLGPLAPVALSPFFGITLLSGLAIWGPEWMPANSFLSSSTVLNDGRMFGVFLVLTFLTSIPRMTKVSKPFAQAMDRLETYGTIVTLLVIRFMAPLEPAVNLETPEVAFLGQTIVQAGIFSVTASVAISIAMVINILVINSVKFFFEFLIWLTPIPTLDALFELANKSFCAALMGLYAFSPTLATLLNMLLLGMCAVVLRWMHRRVNFYRSMVFEPLLAVLWRKYSRPNRAELTAFPTSAWERFPALARLQIVSDEHGWRFRHSRWFLPAIEYVQEKGALELRIEAGLLTNTLLVTRLGQPVAQLTFSQRHRAHLEQLATLLGAEITSTDATQRGWTIKEFHPVA